MNTSPEKDLGGVLAAVLPNRYHRHSAVEERDHKLKAPQVLICGSERGRTPQVKKEMKRRNAIEAVIDHMKTDGKLGPNHLLGTLDDTIHALLCGVGYKSGLSSGN